MLFAEPQRHRIIAVDAESGEERWRFTAGGRVTTPPSLYRGLALFGAHDGYVYAVSAADGELAWRRRAAPSDRRILAYGQVESAWPVGNVLLHRGLALAISRRTANSDGGALVHAIEPKTGNVKWSARVNANKPRHGKPDLLVTDGKDLFMMNQCLNMETGEVSEIEFKTERVTREWNEARVPRVSYPEGINYLRSGQVGFTEASWTLLDIGLRRHQSSWSWGKSEGELLAFAGDTGYAFQIDAGSGMYSNPRTRGGGRIEARELGAEKVNGSTKCPGLLRLRQCL